MGNNIRIIIILIYAVLQLAIVIEAQAKIQSRGKTRFTPEASYYDDSLESLFKFRPQYNKSELSDEFYLDDELGSTRKSILVDVPRVTSKFSMSSHQFTKTRQTVKLLATTKDSRRKKDIKKRTDLQNNNNYASRRFDAFIRNPPIQGLRKSPLEQKIGKNEYDLFPKQEKRRRARQSSTTEVLKTKKEIDKRKSRLESSFLVDSKPVNKQKSPTEQKSETAMAPKLEIYVFPDIRRVSKSMNYNIYSHGEIGQLEDGNYTEHFKLFLKSESKPFKIDTSVNKTGRVKSSIVSSSSQSPSQLLTKRVISLSKKKRLTRSSTNNTNPISKTNSTLFQKYEVQNDLKASLNNLKSTLQYFNTTTDKTQKDKSRNKKFSEKQQNLSGENQRRFSSKFTTESTVSTVKTQNLENFSNFDVNKLKNSYKFSFSKFSSRYREPTSKLSLEQEKEKNTPVHTPKIPTMTVESSSRFPKIYTFETNSNKNSRKPIARSINKINSEQEGFWNIVDPIDDGLTKSEIAVDSSEEYVDDLYDEDEVHRPAGTATVSIFEALADILSKRTENPENVVKNKTTPSTTTSTTTTTTELPIIIQENPVLLDILKRKYIKNDVSLKSQSVFSLTTLKSIPEDETFDPIFKENVSDMSEQSSPISTTSKATSNINNTIKVTHSFSQGSNINEIGEFGLDDPLTLSMEDNKNRSLNLTSTLVSKYLKNIEMVSNSTVSTTTQKPDEFIKPYTEKLITHTSTQNPMLNPIKTPVNKSSGSLVPNISQDIVTLYYDAYDPYDDQENILRNKGNEFSLPSEPITTITPLISDNTQIDSLSTILAPTISPSQTKLQTTNYKKTLGNNNLEQNLRLLQELLRIQANMVTTGQKSTIPQVFSSTSAFTTTTLATKTMKPITIATTSTIAATSTTNTIIANATIEKTNKLSNSDDIRFLINLRQLLFGQQQQTSIEKPYEPKNVPSNTTPTILRRDTIPSTTPKKTTTTHTTTTNPKLTTHTTTPATQSYSTPTVKPLVNSPTVRSLSNIKSNTIEQLLNSFQNTRTTLNPNKNRDVEFLSALRQFAKFNNIVMAKPTTFADRLVETVLQNQLTSTTSSNNSTTTTTQKYQPQTSRTSNINFIKELQTEQEDLKSINDDLVLLSSLLGRKVSIADIPSLRNEIITNRSQKQAPTPKPRISTKISKNQATEIGKNLQLLSSLLGRQITINELPLIMSELKGARISKATEAPNLPTTTERTTTTTKEKIISTTASASKLIAPTLSEIKKPSLTREQVLGLLKTDLGNHEDIEVYGKSNEALLASVLKQIGIGPVHNNVPVNVDDLFVIEPNSTPYTTTQAPRKPPPLTRRPIIEGIQWLWKTWQETAPTTKKTREKKHQSTTASTMKNINYGGPDALIYTNHAEGDDDLSFQAPLTGFDGEAFITTAISITRAVSSFLGTALTGAAKTVSGALEGNEPEFYNLSGKR